MVWSTLPDGHHDYYNARWYEFTGVPAGSTDGDAWAGMFHPDDQPRAWERWRRSLSTGEPYEVEYRLRHWSGEYRWTIGRAQAVRDGQGRIVRWIGTCTDIHEAKRVAEHNELLSRELSHRIKNIFAVVIGLVGLMVRQFPGSKDFATDLRRRLTALGMAHELVRPHSEESKPIVGPLTLKRLLEGLFEPYPAYDEGRLTISGDDVVVDDRGATPIALLFHELATNAVKYGSLSAPDGRVAVVIAENNGRIVLTWRESGGPVIAGEPTNLGFGTRLTEISVIRQLDGTLSREWSPTGLVVTVTVKTQRLSRAAD